MKRIVEAAVDQGATRSYLPIRSQWSRAALGDPRAVLWMRLLPLVSLLPAALLIANPSWPRYEYLVVAFPALVALVNGPALTAAAAAAVTALVAAGSNALGLLSVSASGWFEVAAVLSVGTLSVLLAWARKRMVRRLLNMTSVAETTQAAILPELPERVGTVRVASVYRTAEGSPGLVGGDFFDAQDTEFGLRVVVGDVQGHDLSTVQVTESILGSFREGALDDPDLVRLAARLERRVRLDNEDLGDWDQRFATAALIEIPPGSRLARVVLCGHPAPLLVHERTSTLAPRPRPPLGLADFGPTPAEVLETELHPGDLVIAFTDGLIEAQDREGRMFPLMAHVDRHVSSGQRDPQALRERLGHDFYGGGFKRADDLSMLILQVPGHVDGPAG